MRPLWIVGILVSMAAPAWAEDRGEARKEAETCEQEAKAAGDGDRYDVCAGLYLAIYNQDPSADGADELLYNAAVLFEVAPSIAGAIAVYQTLIREHPTSRLAPRALARLGGVYARIGYFAEAAEALETYARKYAGEQDAYAAMSDAVYYRRALGEHEQVIADTLSFIKAFGAKRPDDAAAAFFALTGTYQALGDDDLLVAHLRKYLKTYGVKGGAARQILAYATLGEVLWRQSCAGPSADGLCVKVVRVKKAKTRKQPAQPLQCGPDATVRLAVVARDADLAEDAAKAFQQAVKLHGGLTGGDADDLAARAAAAQARLHLAEALHEEALAIVFPSDLNFDPVKPARLRKSMQRFARWVGDSQDALQRAATAYREVVTGGGGPAAAIDAAARLGELWQWYADTLSTVAIPADVRRGKHADQAVEAFCSLMQDQAQPAEAAAIDAYGACLGASSEASTWRPASRRCEAALGRLRPDAFPLATELRAAPTETFTWR